MAPIPEIERSPLLKPIVVELYKTFASLIMEKKSRADTSPLGYLLQPWLNKNDNAGGQAAKDEILALGIDGALYVDRLEQVLGSDKHLRQCCAWVSPLIDHIDRHLGVSLLVNLMGTRRLGKAEADWKNFIELTYGEPLTMKSFTHLFNLRIEQAQLNLGKARIETLSIEGLSGILGEDPRAVKFFHRPGKSECFIVFEHEGWTDSPEDWLSAMKDEAEKIVFFMQLFKPGVLHTTYTVPFTSPQWANTLWSRIMSPSYIGTYRGSPHKQGQAPYTLNSEEVEALSRWVNFYQSPAFKNKLPAKLNGFGQMLLRASEYYRSSLSRERGPERLVDLAIALESLFTPASAKTELTFRISQNVSQLIGDSAEARTDTAKLVKKLYDRRSELLHGQYDYDKFARGEFVSDEELDIWTNIIRRAILRLTIIFLRGEANREEFLTKLSNAALDQAIGERMRSRGDPDAFLAEHP